MVLFLTICSLNKSGGGEPAYDEGAAITSVLPQDLKAQLLERREVARQLVTGDATLEWQGVSLSELDFNRGLNRGVDFGGRRTAVYLPAVHRYDGRFFHALGADGRKKLAESGHHTLFLSGLYGLLRPSEPIQLYSCPLSAQVAELWDSNSLLTKLLCEYIERCNIEKIFDLTAVDAYRRLIDWRQVVEDTGAKVLHCFDAMAAGDYALISFGQVLASSLLDLSEDELLGVRPETEMGSIRFRSLPQPSPGDPEEEAAIRSARQEEDILQPLPLASLGEALRGGNPVSLASDDGSGSEWSVKVASGIYRKVGRGRNLFERTLRAAVEICRDPLSPRGSTIKPLKHNLQGLWEYRIGGFRLIYQPDKNRRTVLLIKVDSRGDKNIFKKKK